jgi:hypothetical protein
MKKSFPYICLLLALFYSSILTAQTNVDPDEISSTVKELADFHEIIFPMWHEAYPAKDYDALKELVPKIKSYMDALNKAELPGILRDKETPWKNQLNELNNSARNYYIAAQNNDNDALLAAAEDLHSGYEKMVRVIRPALKEIDDFHQTLYIIFHKLYPEGKYDEIALLEGKLITKAQAIMDYPVDKLKSRLGDNVEKFDALAKKLYETTSNLAEVLKGTDKKMKEEAILDMHTAYEELDSLFK